MRSLQFDVVQDLHPSEKFSRLFERTWPVYKAWYLDEGEAARPTYLEALSALTQYMPELLPIYRSITEAVDASDLQSRFLTLYRPPPFFSGCSQLACSLEQPLLIRNYDFPPLLCEGVILSTQWLKKVIAMTDCAWGVLDGINEDGLAVSIAYGGRLVEGDGFAVTLVLRYILETCSSVDEAVAVLKRVPVNLDYNIVIMDKTGTYVTVAIAPDEDIVVLSERASTNHQGRRESLSLSDSHIRMASLEQLTLLPHLNKESVIAAFLQPPLYRDHAIHPSGTLYTAVYEPAAMSASYIWQSHRIDLSFSNFTEMDFEIAYGGQ